MKKKITAAFLVFTISILSTSQLVLANDTITTFNGKENKALDELLRYAPCSGGGKHSMYGKGLVTAYRGSRTGSHTKLFEGGTMTQCSKCYQVLATEENPYWKPAYLGWYTMDSGFNTDIGMYPHVIYSDNYWYNSNWASDEFFRSFEFYGAIKQPNSDTAAFINKVVQ